MADRVIKAEWSQPSFDEMNPNDQLWFILSACKLGTISIELAEEILNPLIEDDTRLRWPTNETHTIRLRQQ